MVDSATEPVELAGNRIAPQLLRELAGATPVGTATHIVRLDTDAKPADAKLPGSPLWRRAEPDNDVAFAERVAENIAAWIATCAA